jgi:catalase
VKSLKVAVLAADGYDHGALEETREALEKEGARVTIVSKFLGTLEGEGGSVEVDKIYVTTASVLFDAVFVPGGRTNVDTLKTHGDALHFIKEAFKHGKAIGATDEGVELLRAADLRGIQLADSSEVVDSRGVVTVAGRESVADRVRGAVGGEESTGTGGFAGRFLQAVAQHRHWDRESKESIPA